jgi:hypothetical protein
MQFSGVVTSLVGQGSLLGFTVVTPTQDPSMCEDNMCPSMAGSSIGYVVQGSRITELANGTQPRSLLPVVPLPVVQRDPSTLVVSGSHRTVHVPAAAQVIPTTKGAVVLAGRTLFVVTPRVPKLVPVGHTSGRAAGFSAAGARVVWAETLDAKHGRVRAIVVR